MTPEVRSPGSGAMKQTTVKIERDRLVGALAPEFFLGLAHRLWVGRQVFAPQFASKPHYYSGSGQSRYLLTDDKKAREWVIGWLSGFIAEIEQVLRRGAVPVKRKGLVPKGEREYQRFLARSRQERLKQTLRAAGFAAWRQLLPHVEAILTAQRRSLPLGHQLILRQLPKLFWNIAKGLRASARSADAQYLSVESKLSQDSGTRETQGSLLLQYMPLIRKELGRFLTREPIRKARGRPRGRGGLRASPESLATPDEIPYLPDPVDLVPHRSQILKIRDILTKSERDLGHAQLGWLFEITGIWPFHALESMPLVVDGRMVDRSPSPDRPFPHPSHFIPCRSCVKGSVVTCPRRGQLTRELMKDIERPDRP
jgi:hypothetical protein